MLNKPTKAVLPPPSTNHVCQIIIEEMMVWRRTANEQERRVELEALADRLIRYFGVYHSQPSQLDGLPGGHPIGTPRQ